MTKNYSGIRKWLMSTTVAAATWSTAMDARADVPQVVTHQGRLFDAGGVPVVGTQDLKFTIYDAEDAGTELWSETIPVDFDDGFFSV